MIIDIDHVAAALLSGPALIAVVFVCGCADLPEFSDDPQSPRRVIVERAVTPPPGNCFGTHASYTIKKQRYWIERVRAGYIETGIASWYGPGFHGRKTASGETFDMHGVSAAHKTLPLFSIVKVVNLENGREVTVRINDRGPFVGGRLIDLSYAAARKIGMINAGVVSAQVTVLQTPGRDELRAALSDI